MPPPTDPILMSRRSLLRGAAAASAAWMPAAWVLAACTSDNQNGRGAFGRPTPDDPDGKLLQESVAVVTGLINVVSRAIAEQPTTARDLRVVLRTHRRHAEVLGSAKRDPGASAQSSSKAPSETPARLLPRGRAAVLSVVVSEEIRASRAHLRHMARASSGPFAQLLASISAAEAQLAMTLGSELP